MTGEKAPSERKVPKIKELKKPILIAGIIAVIAITGIVSGIVILGEIDKKRGGTFVFGVNTDTYTIFDPVASWSDEPGELILQQVTEGLFAMEGIDNGSRLIMNLARDYAWSDNATELTCYLRESVKFHDGTPFNATAVKWNFDRLHRLFDTVEFDTVGGESYLWQLPDGNWIINETKVLDEYTVKFVLNKPFVPLLSLLTNIQSYMLSTSSTPDNALNGIDTLYGTGPFIYSAYEENNNVTLSPNPDYWGGRPAFDNVIIKFYPNATARYEAMLSGELSMTGAGSWSDEDRDLLMNTTGIELERTPGSGMWYITMNNNLINATMREAISYAFNFSAYANLDLFGKPVSSIFPIRSESPIPKGILYSHWGSFDMPYYNISIARQALKDGNWPGTAGLTANDNISPGNEWEQLVTNEKQLATYNLTYPIGTTDEYLYDLLNENLKQIGVKFEPALITFGELGPIMFEYEGYNNNMLGLIRFYGWGVDYNDPVTMINPLFSSKDDGVWNFGQVNDALVQQWMEEALEETDEDAREQLYFKIEERLIEEVYPVIWCELYFTFDTYVSNLHWQPYLWYPSFKDWYFD